MVRRSPCRAVVAGVFGGVWIFVCYAVAFLITDRLISQEMKPLNAFAICIAILTAATMAQASVPIIVAGGAGRRAMADLLNKAEKEIKAGDLAGAKRHVEAILHFDPEYWPALYVRADILASQGQSTCHSGLQRSTPEISWLC